MIEDAEAAQKEDRNDVIGQFLDSVALLLVFGWLVSFFLYVCVDCLIAYSLLPFPVLSRNRCCCPDFASLVFV